MNPFDLWDQAAITEITRRAVDRVLDSQTRVASQFLPVTPTRSDKISKIRVKLRALGKAPGVIADDATPPIYRPEIRFLEEAYTLLRFSEMTPIEESLRRQLEMTGTDPESISRRDRAGADIITRARALQLRQETLSDYLVMQAVTTGAITVKVANPPKSGPLASMNELAIDYEFPAGNLMQAGTTFADTVNSAPITVLRAIQNQTRTTCGEYAHHFWMSSELEQMIINSAQVLSYFTWSTAGTTAHIATLDMIKRLLYDPDQVVFHVTDAGWWDETAGYDTQIEPTRTRWIPKDRILAHTDSLEGDPLGRMLDGMVPVQTTWNDYTYQGPGPQSYVQLIPGNLTLMWRQESRRIPMIDYPERIVSAKVVF